LDLEPGVGKVQASGSSSVTPQDSTTYTLSATGPGGTQSATARVTVTIPPPPPPPPPPVTVVEDSTLFEQNVKDAFFDFDKADIRADAEQVLTGDAGFLKEHSSIKFTIEGKCDERGSEEYNLGLGDRRATAAKNFLVNAGVSADSISTISYGKSRQGCTDKTEDCWQQNRVDHFHYGPAPSPQPSGKRNVSAASTTKRKWAWRSRSGKVTTATVIRWQFNLPKAAPRNKWLKTALLLPKKSRALRIVLRSCPMN
jgi:peptidoglycan-associated lipoprotein